MMGQKKHQVNPLIPSYLRGEWERTNHKIFRLRLGVGFLLCTLSLVGIYYCDTLIYLQATRTIAAKQAVEIKLQKERIAQLECDTREQRKLLNMEYPSAKFNWECGR